MYSQYENIDYEYEAESYPNVRALLAPEYQDLAAEDIESVVWEVSGGDLEAQELESIAAAVISALTAVIPAVVQLIQSVRNRRASHTPASATRSAGAPSARAVSPRASTPPTPPDREEALAPLKLLAAISMPQTIEVLGKAILAPYGEGQVWVGNRKVPIDAHLDMIREFCEQTIEFCQSRAFQQAQAASAEGLDGANSADCAEALLQENIAENLSQYESGVYPEVYDYLDYLPDEFSDTEALELYNYLI